MRNVFVQCKCDVCGKEAIATSELNPWHHLYEDTLPSGWRQFDNEQFPWVEFSGDQCAECQSSFSNYIKVSFNLWRQHVMEKGSLLPVKIGVANDDKQQAVSIVDGG